MQILINEQNGCLNIRDSVYGNNIIACNQNDTIKMEESLKMAESLDIKESLSLAETLMERGKKVFHDMKVESRVRRDDFGKKTSHFRKDVDIIFKLKNDYRYITSAPLRCEILYGEWSAPILGYFAFQNWWLGEDIFPDKGEVAEEIFNCCLGYTDSLMDASYIYMHAKRYREEGDKMVFVIKKEEMGLAIGKHGRIVKGMQTYLTHLCGKTITIHLSEKS